MHRTIRTNPSPRHMTNDPDCVGSSISIYDPFPRVLPSIVLADEALCSTKADLILLQVPGVQLPNTLQVEIA